MKPFRSASGSSARQPYFTPAQIDGMCIDELRKQGMYPSSPQAIRIDRFVEKRFGLVPQYENLPDGVLGYTRFSKTGVDGIVISAALDAEGGKVAERRVRTTLAHEAGHGLLHSHLFALGEELLHLFDADSHSDHQILCRDIHGEERRRAYDGRWWEFQANRAMGGLLCPRPLVQDALKPYLVPSGSLGAVTLYEAHREIAARTLAEVFDVNPIVARIRINELYPAETGQLSL
ncbi:MAG: ImmA/IrrE family metallo-endopeptidase [Bryobacteraceae bacterium]